MTHVESEPRRGSETIRRSIEVGSAAPVDLETAIGGAGLFWGSLRRVWDPSCGVALVVSSGADHPQVGFEVSGSDSGRVAHLSEVVRSLAGSSMPGLTWRPSSDASLAAVEELVASFTVDQRREVVMTNLPAWLKAASGSDEPWRFRVELVAPLDPDAERGPHPIDVLTGVEGRGSPEAIVTLALYGPPGPASLAAAAMLSADLAGPVSLTPRWGAPPTPIELPGAALHHLLALPARMAGLLPSSDVRDSRELAEVVAGLASPHLLFLGATGLGKSTSLVHLGGDAMDNGEVVVAVDTHDGNMLERLAARARQDGRPVLHVVFGAADNPVLNVTEPPQGIGVELWIEHLWSLIRYDVWGAMPDEYFGPVGEKAIRGLLRLAVISPEFGLADISRLIDPGEAFYRDGVIRRANDREAARVVDREIMPMIKGGDNSALFVAGKFSPFNSVMIRAATSGAGTRLPLEAALDIGVSVLVHAPASTLGDVPARTLIAAVLRRLWVHLISRDGGPRINVILDEWQRYASGMAATMLTESRKYGARLILANQVLTQLNEELRNTVLGNTGAIACYRMSPRDASTMDGLFPTIRTYQLQTLPRHTIALTTFDHDEVVPGPAPFDQLCPAGSLSEQLVEVGLAPDLARQQLLTQLAGGVGALLAIRAADEARSCPDVASDSVGPAVDADAVDLDVDSARSAHALLRDDSILVDDLRDIVGVLFPPGIVDDGDDDEPSPTSAHVASPRGPADAFIIQSFRDSIVRFREALERIEGTSGIDIGSLGIVRFRYGGIQMYIDVFPSDPGYLRIIAQVGPAVGKPRSRVVLRLCAEVNKARAVKAIATKDGLVLSVEEFIGRRDQIPPLDLLVDMLTPALPQLSGRAKEAERLIELARRRRH